MTIKLVKTITEAQFQEQVIQLAQLHNWRVAHFRKVRVQRKNGSVYWETPVAANGKGFPDLELVRGSRLIKAEVKSEEGRLEPEQREWLEAYRAVPGVEVFVWKPRDWEQIMEVLA